jgi:glycosyltransferase involved in cell wall biosynthesis
VADLIPADRRIRYRRVDGKLSIGAKRNLACQEARGEIIAHWDDDDWMAPWRLSYQIQGLLESEADVCGVQQMLFWDPRADRAWLYVYPTDGPGWVVGGSLCYRKAFWERNLFPDASVGEDNLFVWSDAPKKIAVLDNPGFYVGMVHATNTSPKETHSDCWHPIDPAGVHELMGAECADYASVAPETAPGVALEAGRFAAPARPTLPLVSCILATRNRPEFARQAIRCFLRQTWYPSELIVVDDGEQAVEDLCQGLRSIRYVRLPQVTELGTKLNIGIERAHGDIIQKLDDDDYYHPLFLECAAAHLDEIDTLVAWDCFLVLMTGERHLRHSGHGWAAGGTLCFHRDLWRRTAFRPVPRGVDRWFLTDTGARVRRVCEPELYLLVRHGANTWMKAPDARPVDDYFRQRPVYPKPLESVIEPIDRAFYDALTRREAAR